MTDVSPGSEKGRKDVENPPDCVSYLIQVAGDVFEVEIVDDGIAFNPLIDTPAPDLLSDLDDRPIGGLGVHMVKFYMDDLSYSHDGTYNRLKMTLKLNQQGS